MTANGLMIFLIGGALALALIVRALSGHRGSRHLLAGFVILLVAGFVVSIVFLRTSVAARYAAVERLHAEQVRAVMHAQAQAKRAQRAHLTKVSSSRGIRSPTIHQDVLVAMEAPPHLTPEGLVVGDFVPLETPSPEPVQATDGLSAGDFPYPQGLDNAVRTRIADKLSIYFEQFANPPSPHGRGLVDEVADSVERVIRDVDGDVDQLYELGVALRRLPPVARRTLADQLAVECRSDVCSQRFQMADPKTGRVTEVYASRITVPLQRISTSADSLAAEFRPRGVTVRRLAVFTTGALLVALVLLKVATRRHRLRHGL